MNARHRFVINTHLDHIQAKMKILQDKELAEEIKNLQPPAHVMMVDGDFHIDTSGPSLGDSREEYLVTQLQEPNCSAVSLSVASGDQL